MKNVLLTGAAGAGKTTIIKRAVRRLGDRAGGFFVEEVREAGRRKGFRLITLDNRQGVLADLGSEGEHRVGEYGLELATLDEIGVGALRAALGAGKVIIVDEIGPMEVQSELFVETVKECLDSKYPVLGTIGRQTHPFLDAVRTRTDTLVIEVTKENRDALLDRIFAGMKLPTESLADMEKAIANRREKAARYAEEDRLGLTGLRGEFRGDHGLYTVSYENGHWYCNCSFFLKYGTCSHSMAIEKQLGAALRGRAAAERK
ncbi:MAG: NTPase [Actinobacteria bacterium]|nr:NTPase [Actinomycetota bacterium]